jgi:hypothetical protein
MPLLAGLVHLREVQMTVLRSKKLIRKEQRIS